MPDTRLGEPEGRSALRMIREAVEELFSPAASLDPSQAQAAIDLAYFCQWAVRKLYGLRLTL